MLCCESKSTLDTARRATPRLSHVSDWPTRQGSWIDLAQNVLFGERSLPGGSIGELFCRLQHLSR